MAIVHGLLPSTTPVPVQPWGRGGFRDEHRLLQTLCSRTLSVVLLCVGGRCPQGSSQRRCGRLVRGWCGGVPGCALTQSPLLAAYLPSAVCFAQQAEVQSALLSVLSVSLRWVVTAGVLRHRLPEKLWLSHHSKLGCIGL